MEKRTVIRGGVLGMESGPLRADLVIDGDRISAITLDGSEYDADEVIDASGKFVVPAGVDVHTHFKEPAEPLTEGFYTGSLGAIAGGIGTVVEMPQATPTSSEGAHIKEKIKAGSSESIVDFGLWGAAINQGLDKIDEMIDAGVVGIKSFMAGSSPGFPAATDTTLFEVFTHLTQYGIPYGLHAENDQMLLEGIRRMQAAGRKDPLAHAESRPPIVEEEAVNRAIFFAEQTGGQAYICHTTTARGFELIRAAQDRGVNVFGETCPQYLLLDEDDLVALGPFARCAPAIRSRDEVEQLWDYVADGTVDVISSDHCGYTIESKEAGLDDIWQAPLGLSGVQTMYPSIFDEMLNKRGLEITDFVRLTAANPARIFGFYPRKGSLTIGADADIAIYDPDDLWTVTGDEMLHRNKWTPMEGREIQGRVVRTIIRGNTVYTFDGEPKIFAERGTGRFLTRDYGLLGE